MVVTTSSSSMRGSLLLLVLCVYIIQSFSWKTILPVKNLQYKSIDHQWKFTRSVSRLAGRGFGNYQSKYASDSNSSLSTNISSASTNDTVSNLLNRLKSTNIYLVGMMGSGKSTLAKTIANKLGYRPLDTDSIAEYMCEMPIHEFFQAKPENEAIFRNLEYQILMETSKYTRVIFATGGGIVVKPENWGILHHGIVIYLNLPPEDIFARLEKNPGGITRRPLLASPSFSSNGTLMSPLARLHDLYESRKDLYHQADVVVNIDRNMTVTETTDLVLENLLHFITFNPPQRHEWKKKRDQRVYEMTVKVSCSENLLVSGSIFDRLLGWRDLKETHISPRSNLFVIKI